MHITGGSRHVSSCMASGEREKGHTMTQDVTPLFTPLDVRGHRLRNRVVMPPMVQLRPITAPEGIAWYGERARGGAGLVIVEATSVFRFGPELTAGNLAPLVDAIHQGGALAAIQLYPWHFGQTISPADLARDEIDALVAAYETAARTCAEAGFDGVEPHGAHGYLLNRFFAPGQNERIDEYGGSLENRMRLALRIVETVKAALPSDRLLLYRHTPVGEGYGMKDSLVLAGQLVQAGVDVLDVSPASAERPGDRAAPFMDLGVPVIAVNALDVVERALEVLAEGRADLVAVGRGLIADPEWPNKVQEGRFDEIVSCTYCNGCFDDLAADAPVGCTLWS